MDYKLLIFKDPQDKRTQILAAAAKIFAAKGFHQTKVEEIASAAGVGKGTVYEYFSSKTEVFQEVICYMLEFYQQYFEDKIDREQSVREQLSCILDTHLRFLAKNKTMFSLVFEPHPPLGEDIQKWMLRKKTEILDGIASILQAGVERGELKTIDTFIGAQLVFGTIVALSGEVFLGRKDWDFKEVVAETLEILFEGLKR